MAGKFGGYEDEEDVLAPKEPQVTSQDLDERKAARRLRIKRRQEALKRAEQPLEEVTADDEPGAIEQATSAAAEELQRLNLDGAAKVTNVKVTTDEREVIRRNLYSDRMLVTMDRIEQEAAEAQLQYEAITSNWDTMLVIKDPLDIDAAMKEQKMHCDELLGQKDELINELKGDLKGMDATYYEDLEKQDKDIKELSDRIEKQVTIMQRAYEKQLSLIEHAIKIEREALVDHNNKRWEALYRQRDREEVSHMENKFEQLDEHKQAMEAIMWDHHEKYREAKIELECLIQELQKELEKLKATCIINTEKIGYNYQVLKKREEENVFVRSQQKRKLNKMSDIANSLRAKIRKAADDGALEEIRADAEITKLMQAMADLEKKSYHFAHVNNYKFSQVWRMSAARCSDLAGELRQAEVALHAHILSEPPPLPLHPPPKSPLTKYEQEDEAKKKENEIVQYKSTPVDPNSTVANNAKNKLVRHILQLVADNTGFLVEDRLLKLIEKYQQTSRNLCTLDSIFMALEIQAEDDIELLCKTFLNYAFCPICVGLDTDVTSEMLEPSCHALTSQESQSHYANFTTKTTKGDRASIRGRASIARSLSASTTRSAHVGFKGFELTTSDQQLVAEADEIVQRCGDPQAMVFSFDTVAETAGSASVKRAGAKGVTVSSQPVLALAKKDNPFLCPMGHHLEIEPMQVLTALSEFISVFVPSEKMKLYEIQEDLKPPDFTTPSRKMTTEEIESYWSQWKNLFPSEKDRFWDGILAGLNNYLKILQERDHLHDEVSVLRQRNIALRRLVRGALPELTRPPPKYAAPCPGAFTATMPDMSPEARLPPI